MIEPKASAYFNTVHSLMQSMQVTKGGTGPMTLDEGADMTVDLILTVKSASGKVLIVGNGGSAAIASHTQNDLCKAVGVKAMAFNEFPLLTALANDDGYSRVFERQVEWWANTGDMLIAISSSGKSEHILRAVQAAQARGCKTITMSGFGPDNPLRRSGYLNFYVASPYYGYVELAHAALASYLTDCAAFARPK